jgi:hypothetical protein
MHGLLLELKRMDITIAFYDPATDAATEAATVTTGIGLIAGDRLGALVFYAYKPKLRKNHVAHDVSNDAAGNRSRTR